MSDWQDISTAPKDGTRVLVWTVHHQFGAIDPDRYQAAQIAAWTEFNGGGWVWDGMSGKHTHWMPLPEPPEVT